jgi:hypothetical protein
MEAFGILLAAGLIVAVFALVARGRESSGSRRVDYSSHDGSAAAWYVGGSSGDCSDGGDGGGGCDGGGGGE